MRLCGQGVRNPVPDLGRRHDVGNLRSPRRKPLLPFRHQPGKAMVARSALFGRAPLGAGQHAERVLCGEQLVVRQTAMVECVAHCSRQAFNLIIARRIQLFMVPSGTVMRAASSS